VTAPLRNPWLPSDVGVVEYLRDAAVRQLTPVYESSNYVFVAHLEHAQRGPGLAIYKPASGERPLSDFPYGTLHHREVAAYELSSLLGWDLVPPTVDFEGPHGEGSLQLYITHDPAHHYFVLREDEELTEQLIRLAVFDLLANNADRKGGHVLCDRSHRLWAIDNGLCFHAQEKLRTVIWDFAGSPISTPLLHDLSRLRESLSEGKAAARTLERLSASERVALSERLTRLLDEPVLPSMYPWRCTPWPLI
jgi:uncharacterized repeat protein (TIGR03843 family)